MKYGWARVSSFEQKEIGKSINAQYEIIKQHVEHKDIFIDAGKSATIHDEDVDIMFHNDRYQIHVSLNKRPEFKKLIQALKPGDDLYFTSWDRISRNIFFMEAYSLDCEKKNIKLIPLRDNPDKLNRRLNTVINHMRAEEIGTKTEITSAYLYEQGIHPYRAPYGYTKEKETGTLKIIEKEAEIIKKIFTETIKGKQPKEIKEIIKEEHKKELHENQIRRIIKNEVYTGKTHYKNKYKKTPKIVI